MPIQATCSASLEEWKSPHRIVTTPAVARVTLDHFEGRTWRGRHHHVTLVTAAQAFLTLRRLAPEARMPA
ncbi:hypothetical protein [Streptomyces sp. 13-12-16]|uniref:hypothetical protein n=1 Tax=Streptomyces sp. 13-12-16 TaxID=1570823 RepID=UPI001C4F0BCE|nr:hypothetical protein [Streptomyces sp. 13-12-16]